MERRTKKQKRHNHKRKHPNTQVESVSNITHREDAMDGIVCDGEVELQKAEDTLIDVEGGPDDVVDAADMEKNPALMITAQTPPLKPSTSKTSAGGSSSKKASSSSSAASTKANTLTPIAIAKPHAATPVAATISTTMGNIANASSAMKKSKKRRESATSSDEERWLTAIESGKLEDVDDELKKIKDPKLMTARQRAMYERNMDEPSPGVELLMSLPTGYREKEKPSTAEDIQKAALKSQKRKQQADEKREKDKKKTMERLLKKQESKQRSAARNKGAKTTQPMITYRNTRDGAFIHLPPDHEFPLQAQTSREPPKVKLCGIVGCGNPKVYNCSKTNVPLCSFACYRKNVDAIRQIMC